MTMTTNSESLILDWLLLLIKAVGPPHKKNCLASGGSDPRHPGGLQAPKLQFLVLPLHTMTSLRLPHSDVCSSCLCSLCCNGGIVLADKCSFRGTIANSGVLTLTITVTLIQSLTLSLTLALTFPNP